MTWGFRFRARQYVKSSLWLMPLVGALLGVALSNASSAAENLSNVPSGWHYTPSTALAVLTTVVAATVGLAGFVVTVSVLVVQMATGTFSARYMRLWYRDRILKAVLAVLVGTFAFSYALLRRIEDDSVPDLGVTLSGIFVGVGLLLFLVFLNRCIHRLRPVSVAALVARAGRQSMHDVCAASAPTSSETRAELDRWEATDAGLVVRSDRAGAIQAVDADGLVRWAESHGCVLLLSHAAGDFVSRGAALVEVHGRVDDAALEERRLRGMIALGVERTIEQDPAFALRILVDIAIRALSPAVNDPTTATQVIDHLEDTLVAIGRTPGLDGPRELRGADGELRVVLPTHTWDDFLALGVTEIRHYGASSIQVVRRLRAALETLRGAVLPEYVPAVDAELVRLDATVAGTWGDTGDLDRSGRADRQGIGGPQGIASPMARLPTAGSVPAERLPAGDS
jgi:uncharacterized membrane protein